MLLALVYQVDIIALNFNVMGLQAITFSQTSVSY